MIKKPRAVCRDCEKRNPGCHSTCQDYISFKEELKAYKKEANKERDATVAWYDYKRNKPRRW